MDERKNDRKPAKYIGFLHRDPAEIIQPRQTAMLDNKIQIREVGRTMVDIGDIKRIPVERNNRRSLMDMDIFDPKFLAALQISIGCWVGKLIAPAVTFPFSCIEFHAFYFINLRHRIQRLQAAFAIARVECTVQNEAIRITGFQDRILLQRVETVFIEIL